MDNLIPELKMTGKEERIKAIVDSLEEEINYDPDTEYVSVDKVKKLISDIKEALNESS